MAQPNGYTLHQTKDIVVIVTGTERESENSKTGPMLQVWVLGAQQSPVEAVFSGMDSLVCGSCIHRGDGHGRKRTCYVNVSRAPQGIWHAWKRGKYPMLYPAQYPDVFPGRVVRWGAYGDPRYIPLSIIRWASFLADGHTGYTHDWQNSPELREYLMASCDSVQDYTLAKSLGWRTFRVKSPNDPLNPREISCPASDESGHRTTCARCRLCNGAKRQDRRADIAIQVHGKGKNNFIQIGKVI